MSSTRLALTCFICNTQVWSRWRHDFNTCDCAWHAIDGGSDYTKITFVDHTTYDLESWPARIAKAYPEGKIRLFESLSPEDYFDYLAAQRLNGVIK